MTYSGWLRPRLPHLRFSLVLFIGVFLNALSKIFILQVNPGSVGVFWLTHQSQAVFGPVFGSLLAALTTVTIFTTIAIVIDVVGAYLPDFWARDSLRYWIPLAIYIGGCLAYVYLAIREMMALV